MKQFSSVVTNVYEYFVTLYVVSGVFRILARGGPIGIRGDIHLALGRGLGMGLCPSPENFAILKIVF